MPRSYVTLAEHPFDMVRLAAAAVKINPQRDDGDHGHHGKRNNGPT